MIPTSMVYGDGATKKKSGLRWTFASFPNRHMAIKRFRRTKKILVFPKERVLCIFTTHAKMRLNNPLKRESSSGSIRPSMFTHCSLLIAPSFSHKPSYLNNIALLSKNMANPKTSAGDVFNRSHVGSLLKRRFFFTESFEIYRTAPHFKGDNRGLYDYGPPGCGLLANIVNEWRKHFVIEENMLEVDCTAITPEAVLKTSGHVDKFADWMCKDPVKGEYLRADHLVESVLETRLANSRLAAADSKGKLEKLGVATVEQYEKILAKVSRLEGTS